MRIVSRRRAVLGLVVAAVVVFALLTVFAIELSSTQSKSRQDVITRVHERSQLAAALIDSLLKSAGGQAKLYQARYGGRTVSSRALNQARQQNTYMALVTLSGRVLAKSDGFTSQAQADLKRSAAMALVRSGHPYGLGNILPYGRMGVVNLAVRFATRYGERVLLTGIPPSSLSAFLAGELRRIPGVRGEHNYVLDGEDAVLASTNPARPTGYRFTAPSARAALSQTSGTKNGHYYDQVRIPNSTWRIILAAPSDRLFASLSGLRGWLPWLLFAAFALVAVAALLLGARVVRSAE